MTSMDSALKKIDCFVYDPRSHIGKGNFATVYKATHEQTGLPVALKVIPASQFMKDEEYSALFMREVEVLRQIKGEHIVHLLDIKRTSNNLYIVTDFCDEGDLAKKIKDKYPFTEEEACSIIKQIADAFVALEELHIQNLAGKKVTIMHRDIKPANILFHQGKVKVADFGFAKLIDDVDKNIKKAHTPWLGTPLYMAPEILNEENYSAKCDVWSTGMLFYQLIFGKLPWTGFSVPNLYDNILGMPLEFTKEIRPEIKDLLINMLKIKDEDRLSWREVYDHPALRNINIKGNFLDESRRNANYDLFQQNAISQRFQSNQVSQEFKPSEETKVNGAEDNKAGEDKKAGAPESQGNLIMIAFVGAIVMIILLKLLGFGAEKKVSE